MNEQNNSIETNTEFLKQFALLDVDTNFFEHPLCQEQPPFMKEGEMLKKSKNRTPASKIKKYCQIEGSPRDKKFTFDKKGFLMFLSHGTDYFCEECDSFLEAVNNILSDEQSEIVCEKMCDLLDNILLRIAYSKFIHISL